MDKFLIQGGVRLSGEIHVSGAKNAALPDLCASLLCAEPLYLDNIPDLQDVRTLKWRREQSRSIAAGSYRVLHLTSASKRCAPRFWRLVRCSRVSARRMYR